MTHFYDAPRPGGTSGFGRRRLDRRVPRLVAVAVVVATLGTACGGGEDSSAPPGAPTTAAAARTPTTSDLPPGAKPFELLNVRPETQVDQRVAVTVLRAFTVPQQMNGAIAAPGYTYLVMEFRGRNLRTDRPTEGSDFYLKADLEIRADVVGCEDYRTQPDGFCGTLRANQPYFKTGSSWNAIGDSDRIPNVPAGGTMEFAAVVRVKESVRPIDVRVTTDVRPTGSEAGGKVVLAGA